MNDTFNYEEMMEQFQRRRSMRFMKNMELLAQAMETPDPVEISKKKVEPIPLRMVQSLVAAGQWLVDNSILLQIFNKMIFSKPAGAMAEPVSELIIEQPFKVVEQPAQEELIVIEREPEPDDSLTSTVVIKIKLDITKENEPGEDLEVADG